MKRQRRIEEKLDDKEPISHTSLPVELWRLIAFKLNDDWSRTHLRAVCKSWISLAPQPPWLMLAQERQESSSEAEAEAQVPDLEQDEDAQSQDEEQELSSGNELEEDDEAYNPSLLPMNFEDQAEVDIVPVELPPPPPRGFFSLGDQQTYHIDFPQLHQARCVGSTGNWLITAHSDRTIRLLNPFSKQQHYLPPQWAFKDYFIWEIGEKLGDLYLWKVVLSSSPVNGRDCIAMAIHGEHILSFARLGDDIWTSIDGVNARVEDVIWYKGHCYAITSTGMLFVCDIGDDPLPTASRLNEGFRVAFGKGLHIKYDPDDDCFEFNSFWDSTYLVEWLGELLLVIRIVNNLDGIAYKTSKFEIYKFDFIKKKWNELKGLGEHSLFLGFNTSVSLCVSDFPGSMKKNCVYFTDDFVFRFRESRIPGGDDMGVFSLEDNTITPHFGGESTCYYSPPVWIIPT